MRRAVWLVVPPVALVYAVSVVISNVSVTIQLTVLMPILAAVFIGLLVLRDPEVNPSARDRRFLSTTSIATAIVATALGIIVILVIYVSPDLPTALPDHNLFHSWEIDFTELGYSREQTLAQVNLGYLWHAICLLAYLVFVVGAYLLVSIYRMEIGNDPDPDAKPVGGPSEAAREA